MEDTGEHGTLDDDEGELRNMNTDGDPGNSGATCCRASHTTIPPYQ